MIPSAVRVGVVLLLLQHAVAATAQDTTETVVPPANAVEDAASGVTPSTTTTPVKAPAKAAAPVELQPASTQLPAAPAEPSTNAEAVQSADAPAVKEPAAAGPTTAVPAPATPAAGPKQPAPKKAAKPKLPAFCPPDFDTQQFKKTAFADILTTTVAIHPKRPSARVPLGGWISGRATFYGTDERVEASRVACGEPAEQFGVIEHGSCGYTNSDGSLPFPREVYVAAADTNEDYPGSCGRCYQVRCKTGAVFNNGRPLRISDLQYYRPYDIKDNKGREYPGNPKLKDDVFFTKCWDDNKAITVRVGDSCPCKYPIKATGEIRTQNWCCGGNNHFDLSFWAFEQLAHPSYGVIPIEYRPVECDSGEPLLSVPGFVNQTIYQDSIQPGWTWMPYNAKNTQLLAKGAGVDGGTATCATLSKDGAVQFLCRQCSKPGYQPFAKAKSLQFDIRSNTKSSDPYASSTPPGQLPPLKVFMMNADKGTYCGREVKLATKPGVVSKLADGWYRVSIPLSTWACDQGSVGGLAGVDRVDFQNINVRDADVCMDNIVLK